MDSAHSHTLRIGAIIPSSGPGGLFGPSSVSCLQFAVEDINANGGILGRDVSLIHIDGGQQPSEVSSIIRALVENNVIEAIVGMHDSDVRRAVAEAVRGRIPYMYTPPYEGGEKSPGVFAIGETARQQLAPPLKWMLDTHGTRNWYIVGNDYSWPRKFGDVACKEIAELGGEVLAQHYMPLQTDDFEEILADITETKPDAVLVSLIGEDSVHFNRSFGVAGLSANILRFAPLLEENTLLAIGSDNSMNLLTASGYSPTIRGANNREFKKRYKEKFGDNAPMVTALGQSCYEGMSLLKALAEKTNSLDVSTLVDGSEGFQYLSPRGSQKIEKGHTIKDIFLAQAEGLDFKLLHKFAQISPF